VQHSKVFSLLSLPEVAHAMRAYLRSNKWSMTPTLLRSIPAGTMAPATAKEYARDIAEQEMPKGLSKIRHRRDLQGLAPRFKEVSNLDCAEMDVPRRLPVYEAPEGDIRRWA